MSLTGEPPCETYWGSHGCCLNKDHREPCRCICDLREAGNVGGPPYYGPETQFYGRDADLTKERNLKAVRA